MSFLLACFSAGCAQTAGTQFAPFSLGDFPSSVGLSSSPGTTVTVLPARVSRVQRDTGARGPNAVDFSGQSLADEGSVCGLNPRAEELRSQVFAMVNQERQARGLRPLRRNATLEAQAEAYACEMIQFDFFGHDNPINGSNLRTRNSEFGYAFRLIGENLAAGQQSPRDAMVDWMNSPTHRENLLNADFQEIGIGIRMGGDYGIYWVQEFGQPPGGSERRRVQPRFARG